MVISIQILRSVGKVRRIFRFQAVFRDSASDCTTVTLAWQISNTLDGQFCLDVLRQALQQGRPDIFNTDQGAQFTAHAFTDTVLAAGARVSMDSRGRALDNIVIERLWRSVKYERIYLMSYATGSDLQAGLTDYFDFYNTERPHQSLAYRTPQEVHCG